MNRLKHLGRYQQVLLLLMIAMLVVFTIIYPITIKKEGYAYQNTVLVLKQKDGNTIYSGRIDGKQAIFTVSADKSVTFQYGDKVYGPYTAKIDPTAIPKDDDMSELATGVELRCGEEIIFRGSVIKNQTHWWLTNEDGSISNIDIHTDPMEPSISTIFDLMDGPELTHKGLWYAWFVGVFLCCVTAITILFADELFRLILSFRINSADHAEPSGWAIVGRYISWTVTFILALVAFILGLL